MPLSLALRGGLCRWPEVPSADGISSLLSLELAV